MPVDIGVQLLWVHLVYIQYYTSLNLRGHLPLVALVLLMIILGNQCCFSLCLSWFFSYGGSSLSSFSSSVSSSSSLSLSSIPCLLFHCEIIGHLLLFNPQSSSVPSSSGLILNLNWSAQASMWFPFFWCCCYTLFVIGILLFLDLILYLFCTTYFLQLKMTWWRGLWFVSPLMLKGFVFFLNVELFSNLGAIWVGRRLYFH